MSDVSSSIFGSSGDLRFAPRRGRTRGGRTRAGIRYPSPFFDIGHTYLPPNLKSLLRWCRYYFLTSPTINSAVTKMAAYPLTDLHYDTESTGLHRMWDDLLTKKLGLRSFLYGAGLDYFAYGNAFIGINFPFRKNLICKKCGASRYIKEVDYRFRGFHYEGTCPSCKHNGPFIVHDQYYRNPEEIRLMRWNPEDIDVDYKGYSGKKRILYNIPIQMKNDIRLGKRSVIEEVPDIYLRSVEKNKAMVLDKVFHFARQSLAQDGRNMGWGISMILPVLKDSYYMQMLRKAQEMIAQEHIVPLRILFPQAGSGTSDPYCIVPWGLVETRTGLKRADEVRVGDQLKSHTGLWQPVEIIVPRPIQRDEQVYSIHFRSLPAFPLEVSEKHPIWCARGSGRGFDSVGDPMWVEAQDVREGDFVCYPQYRETSGQEYIDLADTGLPCTDRYVYGRMSEGTARAYEYLESREGIAHKWGECKTVLEELGITKKEYNSASSCYSQNSRPLRLLRRIPIDEDLATLLGYYTAEGSVDKAGYRVSFGLHQEETAVCDEIDEIIKKHFDLGPGSRYLQKGKGLNYVVNSKLMAHFLRECCGEKFDGKFVPDIISQAPDKVVYAYLRALFFGDGCFFASEGNVRISLKLANLGLIAKVRELLLSLGHLGVIAEYTPKEHEISKSVSYSLNFNGNEGLRLGRAFEWDLGGIEESPYKNSHSGFFRDGYVYLRVSKTLKIHADTVIGFQMAGDRSFCAFGVATHNTTINLGNWTKKVQDEIESWKLDPNHIPVFPTPIGNQTLGGDGRALLLAQELRLLEETIISGMGVPVEFVKGGVSFSGTGLSMHILKNQFETYRMFVQELVQDFIIQEIAHYMGWPPVKIRLKRFYMADHLQRASLSFQLNQAAKISDKTMLEELNYDVEQEVEIIRLETARQLKNMEDQQLSQAHMQGEAQKIQQRYMISAQEEANPAGPAPPGSPGGALQGVQSPLGTPPAGPPLPEGQQPELDRHEVGKRIARQLAQMPEDQMYANLKALQPYPEIHTIVMSELNNMRGRPNSASKPLPEQKPPRRGPAQAVM